MGAEASRVEAVEPMYEGPGQYVGADIRPVPQVEGSAAFVDYHFLVVRPGSLVINSLSVLYDGSPIQLGAWHIAIGDTGGSLGSRDTAVTGANSPAQGGVSRARWVVPVQVRIYEPFLARIALAGGEMIELDSLAVAGAVARPAASGPGWTVIATKDSELIFPALDLKTSFGRVRVETERVLVKTLPKEATDTRAVGTWSVSLRVDIAGGETRPGDSASWEAVAHGEGSAGFAEPPVVRVIGPDGQVVPLLAEPFRFGRALPGDAGFTGHAGAIGTFVMEEPGVYRVVLEPYPWFDPVSSQLRYARAEPVTIRVVEPEAFVWLPGTELKSKAVAVIQGLAGSEGGLWAQALHAVEQTDTDQIRLVYEQLSEKSLVENSRFPWKWAGPGNLNKGLAALAFLGSDPVRAFHEAARLERWSVWPRLSRLFADEAARALALQDRPRTLLPPPVVLGTVTALLISIAVFLLIGFFRIVSFLRLVGFMVAGLALVLTIAQIGRAHV